MGSASRPAPSDFPSVLVAFSLATPSSHPNILTLRQFFSCGKSNKNRYMQSGSGPRSVFCGFFWSINVFFNILHLMTFTYCLRYLYCKEKSSKKVGIPGSPATPPGGAEGRPGGGSLGSAHVGGVAGVGSCTRVSARRLRAGVGRQPVPTSCPHLQDLNQKPVHRGQEELGVPR